MYVSSLTQSDLRDIASYQILATAFLALTVIAVPSTSRGAIARVLRLWLLRQLHEGQAPADQIAAALSK